jgi:starch synthase
LADRVIAVSPNYSKEIRTPEGGFGIHEALGFRGDAVVGFERDRHRHLGSRDRSAARASIFSADTSVGVSPSRAALRTSGLSQRSDPLATVVTRLTDQKGIDLLLPLIPVLVSGAYAIGNPRIR